VKTELLNAQDPADVKRAGELLLAGQLVAVPTETVYGLATDASNPEAVAAIFAAKQRPRNHPLITHVAAIDQLAHWAQRIPPCVNDLVNHFWPGPLTLLLEKHPRVSDVVTGGLPTIGIRMPAHPVLLDLLRSCQLAVAAPSANPYQKLSPTTAEQVLAGLDGKIAAVLDGGPCSVGTESTILRVGEGSAEILRSGPIAAAELEECLPFKVRVPEAHQQAVSGNKPVHYQPNARVLVKSTDEILRLSATKTDAVGCLIYSETLKQLALGNSKAMPADHSGYRKVFYSSLFALDQMDLQQIWVESPPRTPQWLDIWDRLSRAASTVQSTP
jgi:L-threonylcarbamoyladenylate synthase